MHTINEIYNHFSLQLGHTMFKVVPIAYDINASEVVLTADMPIQTAMIQHQQDAPPVFRHVQTCLYDSYIITGKFHGYADVCTFVLVLNRPGLVPA